MDYFNNRWLRVIDLAVLLDNLSRANEDPDIGFQNTKGTFQQFVKRINRNTQVHEKDIEILLWACNMLNEKGKFRHFGGLNFEQFVNKIVYWGRFNKEYNYVEKRTKKEENNGRL